MKRFLSFLLLSSFVSLAIGCGAGPTNRIGMWAPPMLGSQPESAKSTQFINATEDTRRID